MTIIVNIWPVERRWKFGREGSSFVVSPYAVSLRFMWYDFEFLYERKVMSALVKIVRDNGINVSEWWKNLVDAAKRRETK